MQRNDINVFTIAGINILTEDFLTQRIKELEEENLKLKRVLKMVQKKILDKREKASSLSRPN